MFVWITLNHLNTFKLVKNVLYIVKWFLTFFELQACKAISVVFSFWSSCYSLHTDLLFANLFPSWICMKYLPLDVKQQSIKQSIYLNLNTISLNRNIRKIYSIYLQSLQIPWASCWFLCLQISISNWCKPVTLSDSDTSLEFRDMNRF